MLSEESVPVIEATLPVIAPHIGEISERFYLNLFAAVPALERDLFNRTNQENKDQQKALAGAVAAFATMLITKDAPPIDQVMARIAAKHASLGVKPVDYDVVHTPLFAAIAEVLGDAVTPEVAAAWDEVYWLMAKSLAAQEAALYEQAGVAPGHVWTSVSVLETENVAPGVVALTLGLMDGAPLPDFRPGQYISVAAVFEDQTRQIRQYSLAAGRPDGSWRITVKAVPNGIVSVALADVVAGDNLIVSQPSGSLTLRDGDAPITLVSSGSGIVPNLSILQYLVKTNSDRQVRVVHVDSAPSSHAHRNEMADLVSQLPNGSAKTVYTADSQAALNVQSFQRTGEVYVCGPVPFMRTARDLAVEAGIAESAVHYEAFTPGSWLGFG
ncbi:globin domain-containing protein [Rhodococcus kronopolitis]|uniref:nitric oxide dioxygenase n=1 Tax=Rhodococcus kronopolitis TaxID=1460226 RepID=A0ABV9FQS1_9NOCA